MKNINFLKSLYCLFIVTGSLSGNNEYDIDNWPADPLISKALSATDEDNFLRTRPIIISLGDSCQPAINTTFNKLRFMAYPFDWAVTRYHDLYDILKTDFKYLKDFDSFKLRSVNSHYLELQFPHARLENLFEDLQRRINRFYKAIHYAVAAHKKIHFIIHSKFFNDDTTKQKGLDLGVLLSAKYPGLIFELIVMHHLPNMPGIIKLGNCSFCYLVHPGWNQTSYTEWANRFKDFRLTNAYAASDAFSEHPFQ